MGPLANEGPGRVDREDRCLPAVVVCMTSDDDTTALRQHLRIPCVDGGIPIGPTCARGAVDIGPIYELQAWNPVRTRIDGEEPPVAQHNQESPDLLDDIGFVDASLLRA